MARVLVIDDEELVQDTLVQVLEEEGHEVERVGDGAQGIRRCDEGSFDLVISDLIMPGQEGAQIIALIRENNPNLKIIGMTGGGRVGDTDVLQLARQAGANRGLRKPFELDEFLSAVRALLA